MVRTSGSNGDENMCNKMLLTIFPSVQEGEQVIRKCFDKVMNELQDSKNEQVKKGVNKIANSNLFDKNKSQAIVFTICATKNRPALQNELRVEIKKRNRRFKSSKFFTYMDEVCEKYVVEHEDNDKMMRQLCRAFKLCAQ